MAVPLHLWLKDDSGADIRGSSGVLGREGSIEVLSLTHGIHAPTCSSTGKLMGGRSHRPLTIEKEIDRSSALLYRAVALGSTLQSEELRFYRTADAGTEEAYFTILMNNRPCEVVYVMEPERRRHHDDKWYSTREFQASP